MVTIMGQRQAMCFVDLLEVCTSSCEHRSTTSCSVPVPDLCICAETEVYFWLEDHALETLPILALRVFLKLANFSSLQTTSYTVNA